MSSFFFCVAFVLRRSRCVFVVASSRFFVSSFPKSGFPSWVSQVGFPKLGFFVSSSSRFFVSSSFPKLGFPSWVPKLVFFLCRRRRVFLCRRRFPSWVSQVGFLFVSSSRFLCVVVVVFFVSSSLFFLCPSCT